MYNLDIDVTDIYTNRVTVKCFVCSPKWERSLELNYVLTLEEYGNSFKLFTEGSEEYCHVSDMQAVYDFAKMYAQNKTMTFLRGSF